ncbi:MAG: AAA family ATPase [Planctomycetota bacterium]
MKPAPQEVHVVVGRANATAWYAIPLFAESLHPVWDVLDVAYGTSRESALKALAARLEAAEADGRSLEPPLQLEKPHLLRFRIDWMRPSALPMPVQVDVVQGREVDTGEWVAAVPLHWLVVRAERAEELRHAVALAVMERVDPGAAARIVPEERPELATIRVTQPVWRADADRVPDVLKERTRELPTTIPSAQRALGRDVEVKWLANSLLRPPVRILLSGPRGSGKSTLLRHATAELRRVVRDDADTKLPRVFVTSATRLLAGARWLGEWQEQVEEVVEALQELGGILAFENLGDLLGANDEDASGSLAAFLAPFVARGELACVVEATDEELDACRRRVPQLAELLRPWRCEPLSAISVEKLLPGVIAAGATTRRPAVADSVPGTTIDLFTRFLPYAQPIQAVPFLRELVASARTAGSTVTAASVRSHFADRTGLPERLLDDAQPLTRDELRRSLGGRVLGQPAAVEEVVDLLLAIKAGLHDPRRPLGVLLFCGPTGVGKTELAKALADELFPHRPAAERLVRLDMSEYSLPGAARRLVDGIGEPAPWLQRLRRDPFAVVLLDEIEKADAEVFDVLLSVFDEGRLVDAVGRQTTLCSTVLVMTSNLGVRTGGSLRFGEAEAVDHAAAVARFFRPEFTNRIGAIVPFAPLSPTAIASITAKEIAQLQQRDGMVRRGLRLVASKRLVASLARIGFDAELGARPLQRAIEHHVVGAVSRLLIEQPELRQRLLRLDWGADERVAVELD